MHRVPVCRACCGPDSRLERHMCGVRVVFRCSGRLDADTRHHPCTKPFSAFGPLASCQISIATAIAPHHSFESPFSLSFIFLDESRQFGCVLMYNRSESVSQMWATFHSIIQCRQRQPDTRHTAAFSHPE